MQAAGARGSGLVLSVPRFDGLRASSLNHQASSCPQPEPPPSAGWASQSGLPAGQVSLT